jgi:hypothetical protein
MDVPLGVFLSCYAFALKGLIFWPGKKASIYADSKLNRKESD